MIGIAHPMFRKSLLEEAKRMHYVYEDQMLPTTENGVVVVYPEQYEWSFQTKTMGTVFFRPVKPTDERMLQELYYQLNQKDRVFRFFVPRQTFPHKETQARVNVNYQDTFVIVGIVGQEENQSVVAVGSYYLDADTNLAEIAFTVTNEYRNQGLSNHMLNKLISIAREKGVEGFTGEVLAENQTMLHILKKIPYNVQFKGYEDSFEFGFYFQDKKDGNLPFPFSRNNKP
jgi:RimJ/RimL family protein N-acetyltransferase